MLLLLTSDFIFLDLIFTISILFFNAVNNLLRFPTLYFYSVDIYLVIWRVLINA